jgi:hypothetical protein
VPLEKEFGELDGYCDDLPILEPPPIPDEPKDKTKDKPDDDKSVEGCLILQDSGALKCVSPCPVGAGPGDPCTIP